MDNEKRTKEKQKELGQYIKKHRRSQGITQIELGKMCGMSNGSIIRIEKGSSAYTIPTLLKLERALGISILVTSDKEPSRSEKEVRKEAKEQIINNIRNYLDIIS